MIDHVVAFVGCVLLGLGAFGLTSSNNLVKQLISIEVAFNGALFLVAAFLSSKPDFATLLLVLLAIVSTNETIVLLLLILVYYSHEGTLSVGGESTWK
ncbi:MAG: NADH-quinone oxidoreductase subunit K [Acidilobaceae archaeon]